MVSSHLEDTTKIDSSAIIFMWDTQARRLHGAFKAAGGKQQAALRGPAPGNMKYQVGGLGGKGGYAGVCAGV